MIKRIIHILFLFIFCLCTDNIYAYKQFVLTGGPGSGKSTVIEELNKRGYQTSTEAFTFLFNQAKKQGTLEELTKNPISFREQLMQQQLAFESSLDPNKLAFLDRGTIDILVFGDELKIPMSAALRDSVKKSSYDLVFLLEPLPKEQYKQTEIRSENYEKSLAIADQLKKAYEEKKYTVIAVPFDTPQKRADFILNYIEHPYFLADIIDCFSGKNKLYPIQPFLGPVKLIEATKNNKQFHFFGVDKDQQKDINFPLLKKKITTVMGISPRNSIQLIGDSNAFTAQGTTYAKKFLEPYLNESHLIEYGYTGHAYPTELDVNSFVNIYIKENPEQAFRVLANIVGHTLFAATKWRAPGSTLIQNYVVVYNDCAMKDAPIYSDACVKQSGFTTFGDDIIISDYLLQKDDHDKFICLEGGIQSFSQVTNALRHSIPVDLVYNLRKPKDATFFSTAGFLFKIKEAALEGKKLTKESIEQIYKDYNKIPWDPTRADAQTKKALFEKAFNDFIHEKLYEKIEQLCTFYDAVSSKRRREEE